jgi:hypothetical protein
VRIMAFVFFRPRATWCTANKHKAFIQRWDAPDAANCIKKNETWDVLKKYMNVGLAGEEPEIGQGATKVKGGVF